MKQPYLLGSKDNINGSGILWTTVSYYEYVSDGIRVDSLNWNSGGNILVIIDSFNIILSENIMLGVADYSKLGEELGCKEVASLGVSEWWVEGTTEDNILVTNVRKGE